ncbi:MAG TPA: BON domain-containing protein [Steroidobacteraceae bacterium]|nr:BON domain-containing protein [Steroidobacteraceae bacterium]
MKADIDIKRDLEAELRWAPEVDETGIAVNVTDGIVTLAGYAGSSFEKHRAEAAVKRIAGVRAVANDLAVRAPTEGMPTDPQIARDAVAALKSALPLAWEDIKPVVYGGHVRLEGTAVWHYERESAEAAVRRVPGVVSVGNSIRLKPQIFTGEIKHQIEEAYRRNAALEAHAITVDAHDGEVTLRGEVRSWAEHDQAQQIAWSAPGITSVRNELTIRT